MSFGEILATLYESLPVTAVVFNNGQWSAKKKDQVEFYSRRFVGTNLNNPSFATITKATGAEGQVAARVADVGDALASACRAQRDGETTIFEMMVTKELGDPFRWDTLSWPRQILDKYTPYTVS